MGANFSDDFMPDLTPKKMLELDIFGGKYLTDCQAKSRREEYLVRLCRGGLVFNRPPVNVFGLKLCFISFFINALA